MGLPLFTNTPNRPLTMKHLDESIVQARGVYVLLVKGAKQAKRHLNNIRNTTHRFEALTTQISDVEAQLEASRVKLEKCRKEAREPDEELQWALRYRHHRIITTTGGGDIVSRDPDTVQGELSVLLVRITDQQLALDGMQQALDEKEEEWVSWGTRCRELREKTARYVEDLGAVSDDDL